MAGAAEFGLHTVPRVEPGDDVAGVGRQVTCPDQQLGLVELMEPRAGSGGIRRPQHPQALDGLQPGRRPASPVQSGTEELAALGHHLPAGQVDRGHDREMRARGLDELQRPPHRHRVQRGRVDMQDGSLAQPRQDLVHRLHGGHRAGLLGGHRKLGVEREMRGVRAVDQEAGPGAVAHLGQLRDVGGGAVIRRVQGPQGLGPACGQSLFDHIYIQPVRDAEPRIPPRLEPDRAGSHLHESGEHGLVRIALHQNRFARTQRRERDRDVPAGRSLHQDEALPDAPRVGDQLLGGQDRPLGAVQGVGVGQIVQVDGRDVLAKPGIEGAPTFVAGTVQRCLVTFDECPQCLQKRCGVMVHSE